MEGDGVVRAEIKTNAMEKMETHGQEKDVHLTVRDQPVASGVTTPFGTTGPYLPASRSSRGPHEFAYMKIASISLRVGAMLLSLIAFSVMAANSQTGNEAGTRLIVKAKFSDFKAYNYLLAINVLEFLYSTLQLIMMGHAYREGYDYLPTFNWVLGVFTCDQLSAFLLFSASSSAATACDISRNGIFGNVWRPICSEWQLGHFCSQAEGAVGLSFFCSFCLIASSLLSGFHLVKLMS